MLYSLIKIWVRLALKIFCGRSFRVTGGVFLQKKGPLLITANHPNSFLDAIIIGSVCKYPIYFLARGDAFKNEWHKKLLSLLQMIPIYRLSEGKENLRLNEEAFQQAKRVLQNNGIVLIFIEGICVNKHELQPFKKGAARIALASRYLKGLEIIPLGIAYDSFTRPGKRVIVKAGIPVLPATVFPFEDDTKNMLHMNEVLYKKMEALIEVPEREPLEKRKVQIMICARVGIWLHRPLYGWISRKVKEKTRGTVFFDSVLFSTLMLVYPVYLMLIGVVLFLLSDSLIITLAIITFHPWSAFCAARYRRIT